MMPDSAYRFVVKGGSAYKVGVLCLCSLKLGSNSAFKFLSMWGFGFRGGQLIRKGFTNNDFGITTTCNLHRVKRMN